MTREEAIKTIQGLYNQQGIDALTKDEMTALGMAIRALQAQDKADTAYDRGYDKGYDDGFFDYEVCQKCKHFEYDELFIDETGEERDVSHCGRQAQAEKTCDTCKHSGKNPYTDEPCSECDECMLWEQAQAEKTCDIEKSNFSKEQYKLDTDTAYECGYKAGLQAQAGIEEILKDFSDELRADAERQTLNTISGVNIAIIRMNRILDKFPTAAQADGDLISRSEAIEFFKDDVYVVNELKNMAPVAIQSAESEKCINCKWWRDSDGMYRRGVRAESRCPINTVTVANGWGYCYMFEPQERSE